jgi:methyltransferase (TIGR00027 family)
MGSSADQLSLRNISDTARWVAAHRAIESARPDAIFHDPLAARLAGERGFAVAKSLPGSQRDSWPLVARTFLIDRFISAQVTAGVDLVLNIAAGLDTRPYRMALPASLIWIEVDLPELLDYKARELRGEHTSCRLERVASDLSDRESRRELFAKVARRGHNILVLSEGLLIYMDEADVAALAQDLAWAGNVHHWIFDLVSASLLPRLQKAFGRALVNANAPLKFGPAAGVTFFERYGWKPVEVHGLLKTAAALKRLPWYMRPRLLLPERQPPGNVPWSGVCLMERADRDGL